MNFLRFLSNLNERQIAAIVGGVACAAFLLGLVVGRLWPRKRSTEGIPPPK